MARGINKVIVVGNLGSDPEINHMPSGGAVATLSIATTDAWKDKNTGQQQEATEWHRVVFFNRLAEICGEYLRKGSQVYIEGSLKTRKWVDKSGNDRYTTEIVGRDMQMMGNRQSDSASHGQQTGGAGQNDSVPHGQQTGGAGRGGATSAPAQSNNFDDDIPF